MPCPNEHGEVRQAFLRRINNVIEFTGKGKFTQLGLSDYLKAQAKLEAVEEEYPTFFDRG